jgi:aromatic ring hydroxylase
MGLRTAEEFKESLRDGRQVYIFGERVEDITTHPILKISVETAAGDFVLCHMDEPEIRDLFVVPHPESAHMEVVTVHGEGSMEAQRMMIYIESPLRQYRDFALAAAGIKPRE